MTQPLRPTPDGPRTLRVMTHDSFALSEDVLTAFEQTENVTVEILKSGDAGALVNKAILAGETPLADVLYGVDNAFLSRALDNDIVLPEDPVSAEHCRLERHDSTFRLIDLGSTNKTWVNGRQTDDAVLRNGDQVRVGRTTFVFECAEARG